MQSYLLLIVCLVKPINYDYTFEHELKTIMTKDITFLWKEKLTFWHIYKDIFNHEALHNLSDPVLTPD